MNEQLYKQIDLLCQVYGIIKVADALKRFCADTKNRKPTESQWEYCENIMKGCCFNLRLMQL
jgi:hypothetical protein